MSDAQQRPTIPPKPARLSMSTAKREVVDAGVIHSPPFDPPLLTDSPPSTPVFVGTETAAPPLSEGRAARALYDFEGEASYRELSFRAGDMLNVLKEHLAEGWSMAEKDGVTGLVPESYITYTTEFTNVPGTTLNCKQSEQSVEASIPSPPISPLTTSNTILRGSMFGRRQLNRFSWFVTTGVEEFLLNGGKQHAVANQDDDDECNAVAEVSESDKHYIQSGPSWQEKTSPFKVLVHNPEKRVKLMQEYTIFYVTSLFTEGVQVTVERRFSQFEWLYNKLMAKFGALVLPPLPEKQFSGRFNEEFVEKRRRALERFINRLARHPVIRYSDVLTHFLSCQDESEWRKREKEFDADKVVAHQFFEHVYHPEFNVDDGELDTIERFETHARAMEKLMPWINEASQVHKDSVVETQRQYRRMSYALLRLITGHGLGENMECNNEEGAWCWRDGCQACLNLTKAVQSTAESLQSVADLYESYTGDTSVPWMENMREYSNPTSSYEPLFDMHVNTYKRFKEASSIEGVGVEEDIDLENIRSRCETVFNVTLAEVDRIHDERVQDFRDGTMQFLDGQIELFEKILEELRQARQQFDPPYYDALSRTPRLRSRFEEALDDQQQLLPRPVSMANVASVTNVVGAAVDSVGTVGSMLRRSVARGSSTSKYGHPGLSPPPQTKESSAPSVFDIMWWGGRGT